MHAGDMTNFNVVAKTGGPKYNYNSNTLTKNTAATTLLNCIFVVYFTNEPLYKILSSKISLDLSSL